MRYNKQPTDITTQLAMLKQRGLIVSDEDTALKQLASIRNCTLNYASFSTWNRA